MSWKKLLIPLSIFIVFSIVGTCIVYAVFKPEKQAFGAELAKALIQVATVLVLGQLVSTWVEEQRQKRQHVRTMNELRNALLTRLTSAYSDAKKIRRLTRAKSFFVVQNNQGASVVHVDRGVYDEHMESLNDIQLTLEMIRREIETSKKTSSEVFSTADELERNVHYMESYLNNIIREYEARLRDFKGNPPSLELQELDRLGEFVSRQGSEFNKDFVSSYKLALQSIRTDILASGEKTQHGSDS